MKKNLFSSINKLILCLLFLIITCVSIQNTTIYASSNNIFSGKGTKETPYIIENQNDLIQLQKEVNSGKTFKNNYFRQTSDIDLDNKEWIPIGNKVKNPFYGIYDGNGFVIKNIFIDTDTANSALFGYLGGTVSNLGIESGSILGYTAAAIAGSSVGTDAAIYNCYNKIPITGYKAGGIAESFSDGTIAACWNSGELSGDIVGGIVSSGGDVKVFSCFAVNDILFPQDVVSTTSYSISKKELFSNPIKTKLNIASATTQYMFTNINEVELKQWKLTSNDTLNFSDENGYIILFGIINSYLPTFVLLIIFLWFIIKIVPLSKEKLKRQSIGGICIITGVISLFVDTALIYTGTEVLNWGNLSFIILINLLFILSLYKQIKKTDLSTLKLKKEWLFLLLLILVTGILQLAQFRLIPKYDACLYYGSLVQGTSSFRLDLFTYIGSFVCWKWIHGLVLLIGPFEFLFPGEMIGVYIANMLITIFTIPCLYWLIKKIYTNISPQIAIIPCIIFVFSPYALGLFTHLSMDWHLPFFTIWLLCAIKKKNNLLISFCGFLLSFTKITGAVFYVGILLYIGIAEILNHQERNIIKKIVNWWEWKKILCWIFPTVVFLLTFVFGDHFTIQNFYGTYVSEQMIQFNNKVHFIQIFAQCFLFGFRWLFVLGIAVLVMVLIFSKKRRKKILMNIDSNFVAAILFAFFVVLIVLLLYNSDADCPRYTTIFNILYVLLFPMIICTIFSREIFQIIVGSIISLLLIIQTYWTIDPAIILICETTNTGKKNMYKLAVPNDPRQGMNIGTDYGDGIEVIGDAYAYNFEYHFYDDLVNQALAKIQPDSKDAIYILDILDYEFHISGNTNRTYKIYWNPKSNRRTYSANNSENIYLNVCNITTDSLDKNQEYSIKLPKTFYLIVADRIDETKTLDYLDDRNYELVEKSSYENIYGKMSLLEFEQIQ